MSWARRRETVAEDQSDKGNVWTCLKALAEVEKTRAIQYPMLLGYLRGKGIQPWGMNPILDSLESDGLISKKDSQGNRWMRWIGWGDNAGPLWIHLLVPADATRMRPRTPDNEGQGGSRRVSDPPQLTRDCALSRATKVKEGH
jgi:hypothetical protein